MGRTSQENDQAVVRVLLPHSGVFLAPVGASLGENDPQHHIDSFVELLERLFFGGMICLRKLAIAIPDVSGLPDFGSDVVVQFPVRWSTR